MPDSIEPHETPALTDKARAEALRNASEETSPKEAALKLARAGVAVFPVKAGGKVPDCPNGFKDATTDLDQVAEWWEKRDDRNLGVPTGEKSRLYVLDVDGPDGADTLATLEQEYGELPETLTVATPREDGRHLYRHLYFTSEGFLKSGAGQLSGLGKGLDVRGSGGYVVVAPSKREDGAYRVTSNGAPLAPLPSWIVKLQNPSDDATEADTSADETPSEAPSEALSVEAHDRAVRNHPEVVSRLVSRCNALSGTPEGSRNVMFHKLVYTFAGHVATGDLTRETLKHLSMIAAEECGLVEDDGPHKVRYTFDKSFEAGHAEPYDKPIGTGGNDLPPVLDIEALFDGPTEYPWLVDGVLPLAGKSMLFGKGGSMKTFMALDLALSVAAGIPWHGRAVEGGPVVYIAAEGRYGLAIRVRSWLDHHPEAARQARRRFRMVPRSVALDDAQSAQQLQEGLLRQGLAPEDVALLVADTYHQTVSPDHSENETDSSRALKKSLDEAFPSAAVLWLHHTPRSDSSRPRGANSLENLCDVLWLARKSQAALPRVTLVNKKTRDESDGDELTFQMREVGNSLVPIQDNERGRHIIGVSKVEKAIESYCEEHPDKLGPNTSTLRDLLRGGTEIRQAAMDAARDDPASPVKVRDEGPGKPTWWYLDTDHEGAT